MENNFGLFILINDKNKLQENLRSSLINGIYGFLMTATFDKNKPRTLSNPYSVLADYACCKQGTHIFLFSKRMVTYGGVITENNENNPVFYLNGKNNLFGEKANLKRYIDMDELYTDFLTEQEGVYELEGRYGKQLKGMPFIIEFDNKTELSGKQINVDELYFELGKYNFPLPSNAIQGKGMCTLTPYETNTLLKLIKEKGTPLPKIDNSEIKLAKIHPENKTIFTNEFIIDRLEKKEWDVESELEFLLLSTEDKLKEIIPAGNYTKTRQIPLCPFKPQNLDYADICLYDSNNPIKDGAIPNVIIELKKDYANYAAYDQVNKYLRWLEQITTESEFELINAFIIAKEFKLISFEKLKQKGISLKYNDKIKLYSLAEDRFIKIS